MKRRERFLPWYRAADGVHTVRNSRRCNPATNRVACGWGSALGAALAEQLRRSLRCLFAAVAADVGGGRVGGRPVYDNAPKIGRHRHRPTTIALTAVAVIWSFPSFNSSWSFVIRRYKLPIFPTVGGWTTTNSNSQITWHFSTRRRCDDVKRALFFSRFCWRRWRKWLSFTGETLLGDWLLGTRHWHLFLPSSCGMRIFPPSRSVVEYSKRQTNAAWRPHSFSHQPRGPQLLLLLLPFPKCFSTIPFPSPLCECVCEWGMCRCQCHKVSRIALQEKENDNKK